MFRSLMFIIGLLVLLAVGAMIYLGPDQFLEIVGGGTTAGDAVDAGSGSEAATPPASPEPSGDADSSKPEAPGATDTGGQ